MTPNSGKSRLSQAQPNARRLGRKEDHKTGGAPNAYPVDTSAQLLRMIDEFDGSPLRVSFRDLVSWVRTGERATHYLHTYPAKLLPQIPHFFLAASILSKPHAVVLDPFGGVGTVALEALLSGRRALQADANPLARLVAQAKTRLICEKRLRNAHQGVLTRYKLARAGTPPSVVNINLWFSPSDIRGLSRLRKAIDGEKSRAIRDFLLATFSATVRKSSNADKRFSVPVLDKTLRSRTRSRPRVWEVYEEQFEANLARLESLRLLQPNLLAAPTCVGFDARDLRAPGTWNVRGSKRLEAESVDLIITSPPYAGAQKYVRASSLSLGWLKLADDGGLRGLEKQSIGREHLTKNEVQQIPEVGIPEADMFIATTASLNARRAAIIATYLVEMRAALAESVRVLRSGGRFVLIIGDNHVCGKSFPSSRFLSRMLEDQGLELKLTLIDAIKARCLTTKRHRTAGVIKSEWVFLYEKPQVLR